MLQLVREIPLRIVVRQASISSRGFLFYLSAGFSKKIDPLTGMSVNLVTVDKQLSKLKTLLEGQEFASSSENLNRTFAVILNQARVILEEAAKLEQAELTKIVLREVRGWSVVWDQNLPAQHVLCRHGHFLEAFPHLRNEFDLLKIEFEWLSEPSCTADFHHEGFKILQSLKATELQGCHMNSIRQHLKRYLGHQLPSDSRLKSIMIHHLGEGYVLTIQ